MSDNFYTTEPYRKARERAQQDIDDWALAEQQEHYYRQRVKKENHGVLAIICAGLTVAIMIIYFGVYRYARTNTPSSFVVHQSSGL
jgi:hypothetical protein